jgi:predicted histidine transporter YuiF (NhaC family)
MKHKIQITLITISMLIWAALLIWLLSSLCIAYSKQSQYQDTIKHTRDSLSIIKNANFDLISKEVEK